MTKRKYNWNLIFKILFIVVIVYFLYLFASQEYHYYLIRQDKEATQVELQQQEKKNQELIQEKDNLGKKDYIEKVAREELGMTKQDEVPYIADK